MQSLRISSTVAKFKKLARSYSSLVTPSVNFKPGDKLHGYSVLKVVPVPEFYLTAIELQHNKTGAQHLHVSREDSNNFFGVAFRTTPRDDTGVPHILEHTALCGSDKFPVRDPFFKMLNRSMTTFMNAFTASDWTMYPFSTQNPQDFKNLLSVYLDAAFYPCLREADFRQEGWRLEHEDVDNQNSPIIFKGVVFNEMKGVFSSADNIFSMKCQNFLLPSHTYGTCYGGDPQSIPQLTWEQLKDFHSTHYHPSNSKFFTYGNFPLEDHLKFIDSHALSNFSKIDPRTEVPLEPRWTQERQAEITCNVDPMLPDPNKQTTLSVHYLLSDVTDPYETFVCNVLNMLLVGSEKAPFYQALLEPNIGSTYSPGTGYDPYTREGSFGVGLKGIHKGDTEKVKNIIEETIDKVIRDGFEEAEIEAALHQYELSIKDQSARFGFRLGLNLMSTWIHGADATEFLQAEKYMKQFKQALRQNPKLLQEKVQFYFKDNPHKLTLVMNADESYEKKRLEEESVLLSGMVSKLTDSDKQLIYQKGKELQDLQSNEEDLSCLPTLKLEDIEKEIKPVELQHVDIGGVPLQLSAQPTNGITYFSAVTSVADLPEHLKPFVHLFCSVITKMGAAGMDYKELSQKISLKTGGLNVGAHVTNHVEDVEYLEQGIQFSSHCLVDNTEAMFDLWNDIFHGFDLSDTNRLKMLILQNTAELANSVSHNGTMYATTHSGSSLSASGSKKEVLAGMSQIYLLRKISETIDIASSLDHVVESLKDIAKFTFNSQNMRCAVNSTPERLSDASKKTKDFIQNLQTPGQSMSTETYFFNKELDFVPNPSSQTHFLLPFPINFVGRSVKAVPYSSPDYTRLRVLAKMMTSKFLHREIREKGGAYGAGANVHDGLFHFSSYRDPNPANTLEAFDKAVDWVMDGTFTDQDVMEAKLGVFQQVDSPLPPKAKGTRQFLLGITDKMLQSHREQLFAAEKSDLINVAQKYLSQENRISSVTFLGPENPMSSNNAAWTVKKQGEPLKKAATCS